MTMIKSLLATLLSLTALCLCPVFADAFATVPSRRPLSSLTGGGTSIKLHHKRRLFSSADDATTVEKPQPVKNIELNSKTDQVDTVKSSSVDNTDKPRHFLKSMDGIVFQAYLCNVVALSLPVILLPMAASEQVGAVATMASSAKIASTVAAVSSIATLGGAVGKFMNGFICKELGSYTCSKYYLAGLSICSLLFSMSPNASTLGAAYAGMEFFASMQWASLSVMLSNFYSKSPLKLAAALTTLGLSSTTGMILAKTLGTGLSTTFHWRQVARFGAFMALAGRLIISRAPGNNKSVVSTEDKVPLLVSVKESLHAILTSKLFWLLGLAHSMAFATRGTERILGTFYSHAAGLSQSIAGGMTLSITFGLMYGLVTGSKKFSALQGNPEGQKQFLAKRYWKSFAATLGLTLVASPFGSSLFKNNILTAAIVALLSGTMIANVAFQYYQFPALIAKEFGKHKAVCISFLDGFGFLLSAPIFATCSKLVPSSGWSSAWGMLAVLFGLAGALMVKSIGPVLAAEPAK